MGIMQDNLCHPYNILSIILPYLVICVVMYLVPLLRVVTHDVMYLVPLLRVLTHDVMYILLAEEWNMEDKVTFEQAFQYHGKNFQRIRTMVTYSAYCTLRRFAVVTWYVLN